MKKTPIVVFSVAVLSFLSTNTFACTGAIVGKDASVDGSIMIARNEDFGTNNWSKYMLFHPAQNNSAAEWVLGNGLTVPMPASFLAYSAMPDWDANISDSQSKFYEERGINEFNVAISATTSAEVNKAAEKADPLVKDGIIEAIIPSLILAQAKTAKEGVALLGQYVEKYGAGEGNSLYIADITGAWLFEIGSGHHWIAVRVPDDSYAMIANGLRVHGVDLNSKDVMHSKDLVAFVKKHKLLKNVDPKSFNFAKAFGVIGDAYNIDREWLGQKMLTPSLKQKTGLQQYPLFLKPDHKLSVRDIDKLLSATFKGTELEGIAKRPMRVERQLETHVIQLRANMPKEFQGVIWQSFGVLSESVLVPVYNTLREYPLAYTRGTDTYSDDSAYWQFRSLTALATADQGKYLPFLSTMWDKHESKLYSDMQSLDPSLKALYKTDKAAAIKMASDYSYDQLQNMLDIATQYRFKMMTDLTKSTEKKYSAEEFKKIMSL
ncbi:dipeptidase [Psychromonas sp. CNPT3]|uniref:C69 family dipeptidase n=1 Tax=Psychromonas sp. CNPT3 TaxID=314282 RepID=UPI00006E56BB|nr:C69 family dipeptidase [Psychromonas sp. CNPT3]AGH81336.1 dipeptidase [Psychromonas sp. CNPT3]